MTIRDFDSRIILHYAVQVPKPPLARIARLQVDRLPFYFFEQLQCQGLLFWFGAILVVMSADEIISKRSKSHFFMTWAVKCIWFFHFWEDTSNWTRTRQCEIFRTLQDKGTEAVSDFFSFTFDSYFGTRKRWSSCRNSHAMIQSGNGFLPKERIFWPSRWRKIL